METRWALAIAGAAGVGLYLVHRGTVAPSAPAVPQSIPSRASSGSSIGGLVNKVGTIGATGAATLAGLGPAAPIVGKAGGGFVTDTYGGFRQAASGGSQILHGNVISGTKDIIVGGVKTAAAPITSTVKAIGGFIGL